MSENLHINQIVLRTRKKKNTPLPVYYGIDHYLHKNLTYSNPVARKIKKREKCNATNDEPEIKYLSEYSVIDLETSGLCPERDVIIEFGAVRIRNHQVVDHFQRLVKIDIPLSEEITKLTGITNGLLNAQGIPLVDALDSFLTFVGNDIVIGHNLKFDISFIKNACRKLNISEFEPEIMDTWIMSKCIRPELPNYRFSTLIKAFDITEEQRHRALEDALLTQKLYEKLNEY